MLLEGFCKLPEEQSPATDRLQLLAGEMRLSRWAIYVGLLISIPGAFLFDDLLAYLLTLDPKRLHLYSLSLSGRNLILDLAFIGIALLWWLWCRKEYGNLLRGDACRISALIPGLALVVLVCIAWQCPAVQWIFLESAKVRTEQFSYARSVAFWRADAIGYAMQRQGENPIWLIGSSQMNLGVDDKQLQGLLPGSDVQKKTLPGFGVMQYPFIVPEIVRSRSKVVVCLLSEFDFFREDRIPVNRLRYFSGVIGISDLAGSLGVAEMWLNRDEFADLAMAAIFPLWRDRDLIRKVAFDFWDNPGVIRDHGQKNADVTASEDKLQKGRENLSREIKRSRLLEANFRAFEKFAQRLSQNNIRLLVLEGMTNPLATDLYPAAYRFETRQQLRQMAAISGFTYVDENAMPHFAADDFMDAYHLGAKGRTRLTDFVGQQMQQLPGVSNELPKVRH